MFSFQGTHHLENIKHPYVDTELIGGYFAPMLPTAPNSEYINSGHLEQISPMPIHQVLLIGEKLGPGGDCPFDRYQNFIVNSGKENWEFIFINQAKNFENDYIYLIFDKV